MLKKKDQHFPWHLEWSFSQNEREEKGWLERKTKEEMEGRFGLTSI